MYYTTIYRLFYKDMTFQTNSFEDILHKIYLLLFKKESNEMSLHIIFDNINITQFNIFFNNKLQLKNSTNIVNVSDIYPYFSVYETCINNSIVNNIDFVNNSKVNNSEIEYEQTVNNNSLSPQIEQKLELNLQNYSVDKFIADKKSFYLIKNDISSGELLENDINEMFVLRYALFNIQQSMNKLNETNENVNNEYIKYIELSNACKDLNYSDKTI